MEKIAIVTGCSSDIGKEITLELIKCGYTVIGTYNESIDEVKKLSEAINGNFDYYNLNLLDEDEINNFCESVINKYKHIDCLVNNAGLSLDNDFDLKTSEEFISILKVNLVAPFLLSQKLHKNMDEGTIINIASTDGINTYTKYNIDYSASKAGLINLTKSLNLVLDSINVYAICPNWVNTKSIRAMNQDFLSEELKRINQQKLIDPNLIALKVIDILNNKHLDEKIIVMEDGNER